MNSQEKGEDARDSGLLGWIIAGVGVAILAAVGVVIAIRKCRSGAEYGYSESAPLSMPGTSRGPSMSASLQTESFGLTQANAMLATESFETELFGIDTRE
jgi:hypothetical protein